MGVFLPICGKMGINVFYGGQLNGNEKFYGIQIRF